MLSEFPLAGIYLPPFFVCARPCRSTWPRALLARLGALRRVASGAVRVRDFARAGRHTDPLFLVSRRNVSRHVAQTLTRTLLTLATVAVAIVLVAALWHAYVLAPWTRDARVSAHVADAPKCGTVVDVAVVDNQRVAKGDVLYRIDPALRAGSGTGGSAGRRDRRVDAPEARRSAAAHRPDDLVPREDIQRSSRAVSIAQAEHRKALAALDVAKLDLERTTLRARRSIRDAAAPASWRLRGRGQARYFGARRTQLLDHRLFRGNQAAPHRNGCARNDPADGLRSAAERARDEHRPRHRGRERHADELGLPAVNPTFSWVRLAQRIPVRIEIDRVPAGVAGGRHDAASKSANAGATARRAAGSRRGCTRGCEGGDDAMPASSTASDTRYARTFIAACTCALAACTTVGPDYAAPQPVHPSSWIASRDTVAADPAQLQDWWHTFGDAQLDALVAQAIAHNQDLAIARQRLLQARAERDQIASRLGPTVTAGGNADAIQRRGRSTGRPVSASRAPTGSASMRRGTRPVRWHAARGRIGRCADRGARR